MTKLHIGCGKRDFGPEWEHIDGAMYPHIKGHSIVLMGYNSDSADVIYASHLLEYFDREEVKNILECWHRVLKPGGELVIAVPDFTAICKLYSDKEYELEQFLGLLYGKMQLNESAIYHKTVYDFKSLCKVLAEAGFVGMSEVNKHVRETNCGMRGHWSLNLPDDHSKAVLPHRAHNGTPVSLNVNCYKSL